MLKYLFNFLGLFFTIASCSNPSVATPEKIDTNDTIKLIPQDFNTFLSFRVNVVHDMLAHMLLLDEIDASQNEIVKSASSYLVEIDHILNELNNLVPSDQMQTTLQELTIQYITSKIAILNVYIDFAHQLSIESEWTNEDYVIWNTVAEPFFGVSDQIFEELFELQLQYIAANQLQI